MQQPGKHQTTHSIFFCIYTYKIIYTLSKIENESVSIILINIFVVLSAANNQRGALGERLWYHLHEGLKNSNIL